MRVAVIDLGTNTFNLLIADVGENGFRIIHNSKEGVALGMGGIHKGFISEDAIDRAFVAFQLFRDRCNDFGVEKSIAIGTSAIRDASNSDHFAERIKTTFGLQIEIVDGLEEARLIYEGVQWSYPFDRPSLIMDIGGGSTEFIRAFGEEPLSFCSLDIGVSRAVQSFSLSDPLQESEINQLLDWFESQASELNTFGQAEVLVGASGSFETFYEMIYHSDFPSGIKATPIDRKELERTMNWLIGSTYAEREQHQRIIPIRRRLAPIAALKTKWVMEKFRIREVVVSPCSLKEGVLRRFF